MRDKVVQAAVVALLTPVYEAEFLGGPSGQGVRQAGRRGPQRRRKAPDPRATAPSCRNHTLRYGDGDGDGGGGRRARPCVRESGGPAAQHRESHFRMELEAVGLPAIAEGLCLEILAPGEQGRPATAAYLRKYAIAAAPNFEAQNRSCLLLLHHPSGFYPTSTGCRPC
jgi:hypothetical protein